MKNNAALVASIRSKSVSTRDTTTHSSSTTVSVYQPDEIQLLVPGYKPEPSPVPFGSKVDGVYFDGYPQIIKDPAKEPQAAYKVRKQKNLMAPMRDGVRLAVDIYQPDVDGGKFPALLAYGIWGKDAQEAIEWNADKPQDYYNSPFWDGTMEAGNFMYTVPRGYVHVIPDARGAGNSEGAYATQESVHSPNDIHDLIEWIAAQPWCNGKVGMMGPSSFSLSQAVVASGERPPHLVAIHPDELPYFWNDSFHGIFDTLMYHIEFGRHGNDSTLPRPNRELAKPLPKSIQLMPKDLLEERVQEVLAHPDIKYNTKWYSGIRYPMKSPHFFDIMLDSFHPMPMESKAHNINLPMYVGTPWAVRLYIWGTFHVFEKASTPEDQKKLICYPPGYPPRPYVDYHDETVRWYEYWSKGIDNGIMDEPPIKMFVMGVNKWKFEHEWPLARTEWTKFYLQPQGQLGTTPISGECAPDSFTQPAPYLDPKVYCLKYQTPPMAEDMEVTGPVACYLDAAIDIDDTNWMVDLVDVAPDGTQQLLSQGYLKAKFRALDAEKSLPYMPVHPRQEPVPVTPGEVTTYAVQMMPTANVFKKGHAVQIIIRNQDDVLSRLGTWGVYMLPFMQTVTHQIHFGNSHILLPVIPANKK
jgi:hypothetical protein